MQLCAGRHDEAKAAFCEALTRVPCHASAAAASGRTVAPSQRAIESADATIACAALLVLQEKHEEAARLCETLLQRAEPGSVGWLLSVEPILRPTAHRGAWASALATLRARAL